MGFSGSRFNFPAASTRDFDIISPMTVLSLVYLNPPSFERLSIIIFAVMIKEELIKNTVGLYIKVPSMWFWSVSWSTNCPVFFSFFWSTKQKIVQSQGIFGQSLGIFGRLNFFLVYQNFFWFTKFFFGLPKIPRDCPKIP